MNIKQRMFLDLTLFAENEQAKKNLEVKLVLAVEKEQHIQLLSQ